MTASEVHGPIDYLLVEFPADGSLDGPATALIDLVESGTVRLYDLRVIRKGTDGSVDLVEVEAESVFSELMGARSGLLGDEDVAAAAEAVEPGTVAALVMYENAWAVPFVAATRAAQGEVVASARIPAQDVMDVLDELEGS